MKLPLVHIKQTFHEITDCVSTWEIGWYVKYYNRICQDNPRYETALHQNIKYIHPLIQKQSDGVVKNCLIVKTPIEFWHQPMIRSIMDSKLMFIKLLLQKHIAYREFVNTYNYTSSWSSFASLPSRYAAIFPAGEIFGYTDIPHSHLSS